MATDENSGSPFFETARSLLNAVDGESGDEFIDEIEDRFGDTGDLEGTLIGGIAAGEQVMRMRERSREMTEVEHEPVQTAIEVRDVETQAGLYRGTRVWIDDPHAQAYPGDDHVLVRASNGDEFEVPAPKGVGEIEQEQNDTVLELMIVPPTEDTDDGGDDEVETESDDKTAEDTGSDGDNPEGETTETTDPETESDEETDDGDD